MQPQTKSKFIIPEASLQNIKNYIAKNLDVSESQLDYMSHIQIMEIYKELSNELNNAKFPQKQSPTPATAPTISSPKENNFGFQYKKKPKPANLIDIVDSPEEQNEKQPTLSFAPHARKKQYPRLAIRNAQIFGFRYRLQMAIYKTEYLTYKGLLAYHNMQNYPSQTIQGCLSRFQPHQIRYIKYLLSELYPHLSSKLSSSEKLTCQQIQILCQEQLEEFIYRKNNTIWLKNSGPGMFKERQKQLSKFRFKVHIKKSSQYLEGIENQGLTIGRAIKKQNFLLLNSISHPNMKKNITKKKQRKEEKEIVSSAEDSPHRIVFTTIHQTIQEFSSSESDSSDEEASNENIDKEPTKLLKSETNSQIVSEEVIRWVRQLKDRCQNFQSIIQRLKQ